MSMIYGIGARIKLLSTFSELSYHEVLIPQLGILTHDVTFCQIKLIRSNSVNLIKANYNLL